jgi:hypothetical protein
VVLSIDEDGKPKLTTRTLEASPGQMVSDPQAVFEHAKQTHKRAEVSGPSLVAAGSPRCAWVLAVLRWV